MPIWCRDAQETRFNVPLTWGLQQKLIKSEQTGLYMVIILPVSVSFCSVVNESLLGPLLENAFMNFPR